VKAAPGICAPIPRAPHLNVIPEQMPDFSSTSHASQPAHEQANAEVLVWQSTLRLGFALLVAALGVILHIINTVSRSPWLGFFVLAGYSLVTLALARWVNRHGRAREWMVVATMASDVVFVLAVAYLLISPRYYDGVLLVGFAILHLTEFYYGRRLAWVVLASFVAGYLGLVADANAGGAGLLWAAELGMVTVFIVAAITFIVHYSNFKWRLTKIVSLFERAEEGDFSGEYDAGADKRPDSVTLVGRAYNRVRPQLANLVMTDALSGCQNRRGLEQQLGREVSRAARTGRELSLIAVDIDHFKVINDTFGHLAGDAVIQEVGELLRLVARTGDVVARTGGDEFMLLLPETNAAGAFRLATRVREEVAMRRFQGISGKVPVTVSVGLVADRVADENVMHDLHSRADEALYAAKDGGRNRVSIWTPNLRAIAVQQAGQALLRTGT
jgi:diguanylate cyclase (GGDEF)-like protein